MSKMRGLAASRKGRPALGLQTLIDRLQGRASRAHKTAAVSIDDAQEAARVLESSKGRFRRFRDASIVGGVMSPLVRGVGRAAESAVMAPKGQRLQAAVRGVKGTSAGDIRGFMGSNRGEVTKHIFEGGLGGAAVNASREGLELGRARRQAQQFVQTNKTATARLPSVGKRRILMDAADVWGHNTAALRGARSVVDSAPSFSKVRVPMEQVKARGLRPPTKPAPVPAAAPKTSRTGLKVLGGGAALGAGGYVAAGGEDEPEHKLAAGMRRAAPHFAAKIQPVRTSKLAPIVDDDMQYELEG